MSDMRSISGKLFVACAIAGLFGAVGTGCLTRPVSTQPPTTKTNFTAVVRSTAIDKVDMLFAIDNSASMGDKQVILSQAVPDLLNRLLTPNCVDDAGNSNGQTADPGTGKCAQGKAEFPPVHDMHIGIVDSSLGGRGSDACGPTETNTTPFPQHNDDKGHLINRGGDAETPIGKASPSNFLAWLPGIDANRGKTVTGAQAITTSDELKQDFTNLVIGVHEHGCGYEAQLESWYRFLVQPDPFDQIVKNGDTVALQGVDNALLQQRHDFLRPDSLVAIIVLTDENHSTVDPMGFGQRAWLYEQPTHVKGGTTPCQQTPNDPSCQSCYLKGTESDPACAGALSDSADQPNVRFFHPRQRFGVDPRFPTDRYVRGLTQRTVPDRFGEHCNDPKNPDPSKGCQPGTSFNYVGLPNCSNPLFSANLPVNSQTDLCHLTPGPRTPDSGLVFYAIIGGVPWQLLTEKPDDFTAGNSAPFKSTLTGDDWKRILGNDPTNLDFTGQDPHMVESIVPRQGISADDAHTREWNTLNKDLQYACTFPLPQQKDCGDPKFAGACDCEDTTTDAPLCQAAGSKIQVRGKAYPTIDELIVAKAVGDQGVVASLCPRSNDTNSPDYGYRPAVRAIVDRLKNALAGTCTPQKLIPDPTSGLVPCLILVEEPQLPNQGACNDPAKGLIDPSTDPNLSDVLAKFRQSLIDANGGQNGGDAGVNYLTEPICESVQLKPNQLINGSCEDQNAAPGWCYVTGAAAKNCAQKILFSPSGSPAGTTHLQCIEQAGTDAGP